MANILVIDDDPGVLKLVAFLLSREGHQVLVAPDGFQGLKIAKSQRPDLILLDLMLPGIDGFEVCSRLRRDPSTAAMPVLIVSAKSQDTDRQAGIKVGANGYLTKPYQRSELLDMIKPFVTAAAPTPTVVSGGLMALVGARESEAITQVIVNTAVALTNTPTPVTLVDLRPFSVEQCFLLGLTPCAEPIRLNPSESGALKPDQLVSHPSGLRLVNNLEGSGDAGQITAADVSAILTVLQSQPGHILLSLPLYPIDLLRDLAARTRLVAVVTSNDPAGVAAARSALMLLDRTGVTTPLGLIVIGREAAPAPDLGRTVLATVPAAAEVNDPAFATLAAELHNRLERSVA